MRPSVEASVAGSSSNAPCDFDVDASSDAAVLPFGAITQSKPRCAGGSCETNFAMPRIGSPSRSFMNGAFPSPVSKACDTRYSSDLW